MFFEYENLSGIRYIKKSKLLIKMIKLSTVFWSIALLVMFVSCNDSGFKEHESGLRYKYFDLNTNGITPVVGDIIAIRFKYENSKGEIIEESEFFRTQLKEPSHAMGSIEDALAMMHKGDSALFLIKAEDYYTQTRGIRVPENVEATEYLHFYIKMVDIISFDEFKQERHSARISNERLEDKLLEEYIERSNISIEPTSSGLYYIEMVKGKGPAAVPGRKVTVNYIGYFIDGQIFDSSYDRKKPFTFKLGIGEVIHGWEEGISKMNVGGKAKLVIPSSLAYKDQQMGPVPPYATLVFDIELVSIEQ